ncbi:MAG: HAMP domain-containing protein [Solirubrobacterales bacterium]|nr:HAMP domain-containing protein [Solirubrobacterales bacterium]
MRRLSIRAKLTAAFAAASLLVLALAGLFVYLRVQSDLTDSIDGSLENRADELAARVSSGAPGSLNLGSQGLVESEDSFAQILTPRGTVLVTRPAAGPPIASTTLEPGAGPALDRAETSVAGRRQILLADRELPGIEGTARILAGAATGGGRTVVIVVGASTVDREEALSALRGTFLIATPVAILLASGFGYLLAGRAIAPVAAMRRRAEEITLERSGERLPLPRADDEIHQLGETLNAMLDRIEVSLDRERVFVADASHELRTPLAILRTELELADRPGRSTEELLLAVRSAGEEVDRLSRLAEDLLVIARSDRGELPISREAVQLDVLLGRVSERFAARAAEGGRELVVSAPAGTTAELDAMRVEQALGNLVDNALRHGEGEIRLVAAGDDAGRCVIEVSDQGAGFPADFAPQAFERFTRADSGRTGEGAGLGLAIVKAVAEAHGGAAEIMGSRVRITF